MTFSNIFTNQKEEELYMALIKVVTQLEYRIIKIRISSNHKNAVAQIIIDKCDGTPISIDDCTQVSKHVSVLLKVCNVVRNTSVEISSPGVDRPLTTTDDLFKYMGQRVKLCTRHKLCKDGRRIIHGVLFDVTDDNIVLQCEHEDGNVVVVQFDNICDIHIEQDIASQVRDPVSRKNMCKKRVGRE